MANFKISNVRRVPKNKKGETINLTLIYVKGYVTPIIRRPKEFIQDLKNSFIIGQHIDDINHLSIIDAMKDIKGGTVQGDVSFLKKGDMWTVTENSRCITNKNHPKFGTVSVGDQLPAEDDSFYVNEGFLTIEESFQARAIKANAKAYAQQMADALSMLDEDEPVDTTNEAFDDIPAEFASEAVAE